MKLRIYFLCLFFLYCVDIKASNQTTLEADSIVSQNKNTNIEAKGNVVVKKDNNTIFTESILYNTKENIILLNTNSKLKSTNSVLFAEDGVLKNNMQTGEFNNAGIIFKEGLSVLSKKIIKKDENTYRAIDTQYYLCPDATVNKDLNYNDIMKEINKNKTDIFSIYSKESIIKVDEKKIYLKHNQIRLFNFPIFYFPYIYTSRPFIDKLSGFQFPNIENSRRYGMGLYIPYVWYITDNIKTKIEFGIHQYGSMAIKNNFSINNDYSDSNIKTYLVKDNEDLTNYKNAMIKPEKFRAIFEIKSKGYFNNNFFYDLNLNFLSDSYIYRDYLADYDNFKKSIANFSYINFDTFNYINLNLVSFQELLDNSKTRQNNSPILLPTINSLFTKELSKDTYLNLYTNTTSSDIFNLNDIKYTKLNSQLNIENYGFNDFFQYDLNLNLYNDFYFNDTSNNKNLNNYTYRAIPEFSVDLRNFYSLGNNFIIEPIFQYYVSPTSSSFDTNFINEDSRESEINILNLFNGSRFNGNDRREYGSRLNYGLISKYYLPNDYILNFQIGQAYKSHFNKDSTIRGFKKNISDILVGAGVAGSIFDLNLLMNFDNNNFDLTSTETIFNLYLKKITFFANYSFFKKDSGNSLLSANTIETGLKYNFLYKYNISFSNIYDFEFNKQTKFAIDLFYENKCIKAGVSFEQLSYKDSPADNRMHFYFRLQSNMF